MGKTRPPYPPESRRQMVELVRAGRNPEEPAPEFDPSAQSILKWIVQVDLDEGLDDGLPMQERAELGRVANSSARSGPGAVTWGGVEASVGGFVGSGQPSEAGSSCTCPRLPGVET